MLPQTITNSLISGSIYTLVALGFSFLFYPTKFFNIAYGAVVLLGGYFFYTCLIVLKLPFIAGFFISVMLCAFLGYLFDKILFAPLRKRNASNMVYLVASLGLFTCLQALTAIAYGSYFRSFSSQIRSIPIEIFGTTITNIQILILVTVVVSTFLIFFLLKFTKYGKAVKAISDNLDTSKIVGIHTNAVLSLTFSISFGLAGVAGILLGLEIGLEPAMGMIYLLKGAIAALIGGFGSIIGAFIGGYILGFSENFGSLFFPGQWKEAISFVILILFLLVKPSGIFNRNIRKL